MSSALRPDQLGELTVGYWGGPEKGKLGREVKGRRERGEWVGLGVCRIGTGMGCAVLKKFQKP